MWKVISVTSARSSVRTASQTRASSGLTAGMESVSGIGVAAALRAAFSGTYQGGEAGRESHWREPRWRQHNALAENVPEALAPGFGGRSQIAGKARRGCVGEGCRQAVHNARAAPLGTPILSGS